VFVRTLLTWLRSGARRRGIPDGQSGAVTFTQRFGSSVALHAQWHGRAVLVARSMARTSGRSGA
jgi:hypothetical protein